MAEVDSYCQYVRNLPEDDLHKKYHDQEYGFPLEEDNALFGRLILEINQAGLSWTTILKKKEHFEIAYDGFNIQKIASYGEQDRNRLLQDAGVIRNRLKVDAAMFNAQRVLALQQEFGSFKGWIEHHHPLVREEWVKVFKKAFRFTGGEIVNEFLMSTGYLPGAHERDCPIYNKWAAAKPKCLI